MASYFLGPDPLQSTFFIPGGATPGNGVQVFIYLAGTSTKQTVYKDNLGNTAWSNPIVLDSGGNLASGGVIWIPTGVTIKAVWAPSNDIDPPQSPYRTIDNIAGINDTNALVSEWITGSTPTFVSGTQFNVSGDLTGTLTNNRRLKTTNTAGSIYSTITQRSFAAGSTTVNVVSDTGSLDSGLSALAYGIADPNNTSIPPSAIYRKAANVASAGNGTTDIWGTIGDYVHITGTNTVFHFSSSPYAGMEKTVVLDGALTLAHSTSAISIPGLANVTTAANDRFRVRAETVSTSVITQYTRANQGPKLPTRQVLTSGTGATYTTPAGCTRINVRAVGAGGGGGAANTNAGTNGTATTFSTLSAGLGVGGATAAGTPGTGGAATGGDVNIDGAGAHFQAGSSGANQPGGAGAASVFGGAGVGAANVAGSAAKTNSGSGGGGGGAAATTAVGQGGGAGGYVEKLITSPSATYTYTVGAKGTGGVAGGAAGGDGAAGLIIVDEWYD